MNINEKEVYLKDALDRERNIRKYRRLKMLYLLKVNPDFSVKELSGRIGVTPVTVYAWKRIYRKEGITIYLDII